MSSKCENCGRSVLETDTVCWHCGWSLSPEGSAPAQEARTNAASNKTGSISLSAVAVIGGVTIVNIIAALLVMRSLGRQPTVLTDALEPGWDAVADAPPSYTLNLPPDWDWLEGTSDRTQTDFEEVINDNDYYLAIIEPLGEPVREIDLLGVAKDTRREGGMTSGFLLLARDARASRPPPDQAITRFQTNEPNLNVLDVAVTDASSGEQYVTVVITFFSEEREHHCREMFVPTTRSNFLVVICSLRGQSSAYSSDFQKILSSFRIVTR
jgi:hypothetical protein